MHAGINLYSRITVRLSPLIPSDLVLKAFELAWNIRNLNMRAAPYDFIGLKLDHGGGWSPVKVEMAEGKREYQRQQVGFSERARPIRQRLIEECERLLR
jgi:hypothetical protein